MENEELRREKRAIDCFVSMFNGSYTKLDPNDIDYKIFDVDNKLVGYGEVSSRIKTIRDAYPLSMTAKKFLKLSDKRLNPVAIWSCEDGIIYAKIKEISGIITWDDDDFVIYFEKQKAMKYVRFT